MANQFVQGFSGVAGILRYAWVPEDYEDVGSIDPDEDASYEW